MISNRDFTKATYALICLTAIATLFLVAQPSALAERGSKFSYLMYSDPLVIRLTDESELKIQITAHASKRKDKLLLVVNDRIADEAYVRYIKRHATLRYEENTLSIRANCTSYIINDNTYNHRCKLKSGKRTLGILDVNKRIYSEAENSDKEEAQIQPTPNELLELTAYCARVLHAALPQNSRPMYGRSSTWC
jgi:hypothetical protein